MRFDRIGIVMLTAAGDAVHTLPIVNAIKRDSPATRITWVIQPGPAALVRGHPSVDDLVIFDRRRGWRGFLDVRREIGQRPFDIVLDLQSYLKAGLITSFTRSPLKLGYDRPRARDANWLFTTHQLPPHPPQHVQDEFLEFLRAIDIPAEPLEWRIGPWEDERPWQRELVARFDRPIAALVIGSSRPEKDWVAERWAEVADALVERYSLQPVLVGGRSAREVATESAIMAHARHAPISLLDSGFRRLVSILDAAAVVISLDTGPLHMAVALNRPTISLMGYVNPKRVGPYRRFRDLLIDVYSDPGESYRISTETRTGRMRRIQVSDVLSKLDVWELRHRPASAMPG